jgi:hypothetical protein
MRPRAELETNLTRLRGSVHRCCDPTAVHQENARTAAERIPFAHSTSFHGFDMAWRDGALLSKVQVAALHGSDSVKMGAAETLLGTTDDVFLYLSAFTYPSTAYGFLFHVSLGDACRNEATGTPFDSGGFAFHIQPPADTERVQFVRDHEIPVPECRSYLGDILTCCFRSVPHYLRSASFACPNLACTNPVPHPQGVTDPKADERSRTHEVRIPQRIELNLPHLLAVFVPAGTDVPRPLLKLRKAGVELRRYRVSPPSSDDSERFLALRSKCEDFIAALLEPAHA